MHISKFSRFPRKPDLLDEIEGRFNQTRAWRLLDLADRNEGKLTNFGSRLE